jgi:hypothetical protein
VAAVEELLAGMPRLRAAPLAAQREETPVAAVLPEAVEDNAEAGAEACS